MKDILTTGPISWIQVDATDIKVGDILLVTTFDKHECYGIVTRCYATTAGSIFCHVDIGMDSIPKCYEPYDLILVGRCCADRL